MVCALLSSGTPIEETILQSRDIREFVQVRRVTGGATFEKKYLGKVVRWYYAADHVGYIAYQGSGNKVAKSDGAVPLMELPDSFPMDVDWAWYVNEAYGMLQGVGC